MTMVESLPAYAAAAAVAKSRGDNLLSMINAYLAGYASAGAPDPVFSDQVFDVAPADPVSRTFSMSADVSAILDAVAKRRGVSADALVRHALMREFAAV
ncbi:CopG family transcriptional regulator [Bifidobacterium stellenboschense]|uniref:ribbon-helix-helix domain-containing protein n=1 Tax=Bifidobacterium stellenboschense TaxID=762211 RepID=UPI00055943A4|nr:CopG family transcriptional regulator [Bifidobacterium stellenboschense]